LAYLTGDIGLRKLMAIFFLLTFPIVVFAIDEKDYPGVPLIVYNNSVLINGRQVNNYIREPISSGEKVVGLIGTRALEFNYERNYFSTVLYKNVEYFVYSNDIIPESGDILSEDWITTIDSPKRWVVTYFLDALRSKNRDTILQYTKSYIDHEIKMLLPDGDYTSNNLTERY
jgi:hypothetical protein